MTFCRLTGKQELNWEMIDIESVFLIIIGVLLFELIVFVHEFGHFITAKKCGVKVNEFALGMDLC